MIVSLKDGCSTRFWHGRQAGRAFVSRDGSPDAGWPLDRLAPWGPSPDSCWARAGCGPVSQPGSPDFRRVDRLTLDRGRHAVDVARPPRTCRAQGTRGSAACPGLRATLAPDGIWPSSTTVSRRAWPGLTLPCATDACPWFPGEVVPTHPAPGVDARRVEGADSEAIAPLPDGWWIASEEGHVRVTDRGERLPGRMAAGAAAHSALTFA